MFDSTICEVARQILDCVGGDHPLSDIRALYNDVKSSCYSDFSIEFDGEEYRVIAGDAIEDIHTEEVKELTGDCFLDGRDFPWWVAIDWEETAKNVREADGYGHHFSSYDGSEYETESFYFFRTS